MQLKEKVQKDFMTAYKEKDMFKKTILGMLKTRITNAEKEKGTDSLPNTEVINAISSYIKQVNQSIEEFRKSGLPETDSRFLDAEKELVILKEYLPEQMNKEDIHKEVSELLSNIDKSQSKRALGLVMKHFKENYNGRFNPADLKTIVDEQLA